MLDTSAKNMASELLAGEDLRDKRLGEAAKIVQQYHTTTYDGSAALDVPENHAFEYISLIVPQMIFENPAWVIGEAEMDPELGSLQKAMNHWSRLANLRDVGIELAIDQCVCWGVGRIDQQPQPGWVPGQVNRNSSLDVPMMPMLRRIPQNRHIMDPLALRPSLARWHAQLVIRDKQDLLDEAERFPKKGWNKKNIAKMPTGTDLRKARPNREGMHTIDRGEVCFYEVWIPEEELDESLGPQMGMHGTIRTIACGRGDDEYAELRKPRPYYGPPGGPFVLFGTHMVPNEPWPMSSLYPIQTQVKDLNNHGVAMRDAAAKHKKLALGDALQERDAKAINNAKNGQFLLVKGLDKQKVIELGLGGIDEVMLVYRNFARDLLDRASGITDAMRGNVTGDATATENAIAESASGTRVGMVKRQYQAGMRECGDRGGWFIWNDPRTLIPTGIGQVIRGGSPSDHAELIRRQFPGIEIPDDFLNQPRIPYEAIDKQLEPMSMERLDLATQQRNALQAFQLVTQAIPVMAQFPDATDWKARFEQLGKAFNDPNLARSVFPDKAMENMLALAQLGMAQPGMQGMSAPQQGGGAPPPPPGAGRKEGQAMPGANKESSMQRRVNNAGAKPKARSGTGKARPNSVGGK